MIEIYYQDAYKIERKQEFDSLDAAKLAFAGCLTLPDYYPVSKLLREGNELEFKGTIGDLYRYLQTLGSGKELDWSKKRSSSRPRTVD